MAASCNQVITITGGPGATSVQHIEYDAATHKLTLVKANGSRVDIHLADVQVHSAALVGTDLVINMDDGFGGLAHAFTVDVSSLVNDPFADQAETDAGIISTKKLSPLLLATYIDHVLRDKPTGFAPLDANGFIPAKYMDAFAITDVKIAVDKAALDRLAATAGQVTKGDIGVATAESKSYIWDGSLWHELLTPTDLVLSVNGQTGTVVIPPEKGGIAFKPNEQYVRGDSVSHGHHLFIRKVAGGEATWDATKWERSDSAGRLFSDLSTYDVGDLVSYLGELYINKVKISVPGIWNPASWSQESHDERGGVAFSIAKTYKIGDIVSVGNSAFVAINAVAPGPFNAADWLIVSASAPDERGGLAYDSTLSYKLGDVVSENNLVYVCVNLNNAGVFNAADWKEPSAKEKGGILYDTSLSYVIGDIVTYNMHVWRCVAGTTGAWTASAWENVVSSDEKGGVQWDTNIHYDIGDVVSRAGSPLVFIATTANSGSDPLNLISWQEVDSIRYNVGAWTPSAGNEYPDITTGGPGTSGEHIAGAVWWMSGLDPVTGYTFTSGKLIGIQMFNNDKMVFQGEDATSVPGVVSPIWLNEPFPKVKGEVGGVPYSSVLDYEKGDVTVDYPYMYMALSNQTPSITRPSVNPVAWQKLNTDLNINLEFNASQAYVPGDVVLSGGQLFYTAQNVPANTTAPGTAPWVNITPAEKGGLAYDSTLHYNAGDIVTHASIAYKCINGTTGSFVQADWVNLATDDESGGVQWKTSIKYQLGDVVSRADSPLLFICTKAISQGSDPLNLIDWQEVDSIRYNVGVFTPTAGSEYPDYTTGGPGVGGHHEAGAVWFTDGVDTVTGYTITGGSLATKVVMNNDKYVFQGMDVTTTPGTPTPIWLYEAFPRVKGEVGGVAFSTNVDYDKGDVTVDFGNLYLALKNVGKSTNTPSTTPADWKLLHTDASANTNYDPTKAYVDGNLVSHNGNLYLATGNAAIGVTPPNAPWLAMGGDKEVGGRLFDITNKYLLGDVITYSGSIYKCLVDTTGVWDPVKWEPVAATLIRQDFVATAKQSTFTANYDPRSLVVLSDGIEMQPAEYTATNGTTVVFKVPVDLDTWIKISSYII